jgi:hypothetical protein
LSVIFVRHRVAKVDHEAVSLILGNIPVKLLNHPGTHLLILAHDLMELFGV